MNRISGTQLAMALVGGLVTISYAMWMLIAAPPVPVVLAILIYLLAAIGVAVIPVYCYLWTQQRKSTTLPGYGAAMLVDRHGAKVDYTESGISGITTAYDKHGTVLDEIYVEADANPPLGIAQLRREENPD